MSESHPRRRCCLCVPASSLHLLVKAARFDADELVLDLEDAVAPDAKDQARAAVVQAMGSRTLAGRQVSVRVNAPGTPWCHADVIAVAQLEAVGSIVIPKVESAGDLAFVDRLLDGVEAAVDRTTPLAAQALIETSGALVRLVEIAGASGRLVSLILGYADLAASLGRTRAGVSDLDGWRPAQEAVLAAARAHGLQAIDGPHLGVRVDEAFLHETRRAAAAGFDGKWAIHPAQLPALAAAFSPSAEDVAQSRAVIEALARAELEDGRGAVALNGQMLDEALRASAARTLRRAGSDP
jgi:citrate lyase subunit beta/citryl-CoA lyase